MVRFLWRRRTFVATIAPLAMLIFARPELKGYIVGVVLVLAGHAIRVWSAGYLNKMNELISSGPFAYTRNPLYIGSFLICCGYGCMTNRLDVSLIIITLFVIFHGGAILYEEGLLRAQFGANFDQYCKRVPRVFPRLRKVQGTGSFSWSMVKKNREPRIITGTLLFTLIFGLTLLHPQMLPANWMGFLK